MIKGKAITYIRGKLPLTEARNGWVETDCPYCGRANKLGILFAEYRFKCWACSARGSINRLIRKLENLGSNDSVADVVKDLLPTDLKFLSGVSRLAKKKRRYTGKVIPWPPGYVSLYAAPYMQEGKPVLEYLDKIKLDWKHLAAKGFGYVPEYCEDFTHRLIIPFYRSMKLVYYIGRTYTGSKLRYKNALIDELGASDVLYNEQAIYLYEEVNVVEGWADAETLGDNSVAYLTSSISERQWQLLLNSNVKHIILWPDKGYYNIAKNMAIKYIDYVKITVVDTRPLAEQGGKDVNDWGREKCLALLPNSQPLSYGNLYL